MEICFYDISSSQRLAHLNGRKFSFVQLYDLRKSDRTTSLSTEFNREQLETMCFHPYGAGSRGWSRWSKYFILATQVITGCTPSKNEISIAKGFVMGLPRQFKEKHVDHHFVMCFLPYLCAGFKMHLRSCFVSESNSLIDVYAFVSSLFESKRVIFSSFLCSHRDPETGGGVNLLQLSIPPEKVCKAASVILALANNSHDNIHGSLIFFQQSVSRYASSSIFPEVTVEYLEGGRIYELIDRVRYQYELVGGVLRSIPGEQINIKLRSLDLLTVRIERFLQDHYGPGWRQSQFESIEFRNDPLVRIAIEEALPCVKRFMPFFSRDFQQIFLARKVELLRKNCITAYEIGGNELVKLSVQIIQWFFYQHSMTASAKALYEVVFYYLWGMYCGKFESVFGIGMDRDHDQYQYHGWKLGVNSNPLQSGQNKSVPLYARRNPNSKDHRTFADLSFRQFWRHDK
ncbi:MAG: hypothetical protein V1695_00770 [Candidatus Uhrbacteria bacterium]